MDGSPRNIQDVGRWQEVHRAILIYLRDHYLALYGQGRTPAAFLMVSAKWRIHKNTGTIAYLVQDDRRKEVYRPVSLARQDFFLWLHPGKWVDESDLKNVMSASK